MLSSVSDGVIHMVVGVGAVSVLECLHLEVGWYSLYCRRLSA